MTRERVRAEGSRRVWAAVGIGVLALALRWLYVRHTRTTLVYGFDTEAYFRLAQGLAARHRYLSPYEPGNPPTALFPPGLPVLEATLRWFGGTQIGHDAYVLSVVGSLSAVTITFVGYRLFGVRVGVIAGVLAAAYPMFILADGAVMTETPFLLLVCVTLLLCMRAQSRNTSTAWFLVGLPIALAALTRSDGILLWPFVAVVGAMTKGGPARAIVIRCGLALMIPVLLCGAWIVRNDVQMGYPVPIAVNSWAVIGGANCHQTYYGSPRGSWISDCLDLPKHNGEHEVAGNMAIRDDGLRYARAHLSRLPVVVAARLGRTFGFYHPMTELKSEAFFESRDYALSQWGYFMYLGLLPLAAIGAYIASRRVGRRTVVLLLGPVGMVVVNSAFGYGNQRFRIAAEPSLLLLAAVALSTIAAGVVSRIRPGNASP